MLLVGPPLPDRFGVGLTAPHSKKLVMKVEQRKKLDRANDDGNETQKGTRYTKITLAT